MVDQKVTVWAKAVGDWAGDSPYKAATLAGVFGVIGYVLNIWPF